MLFTAAATSRFRGSTDVASSWRASLSPGPGELKFCPHPWIPLQTLHARGESPKTGPQGRRSVPVPPAGLPPPPDPRDPRGAGAGAPRRWRKGRGPSQPRVTARFLGVERSLFALSQRGEGEGENGAEAGGEKLVGKAELSPWEHHSPARRIQTSWMQATQRLRMSMSKSSRSSSRPPLRPSASAAARAELHLSWGTAPRRAPRPPPRRGRAQPVSGTGCGASGAGCGMLPAAGAALSAWRGCAGAALRGAAASACGERAAGPGACARGCGSAECMSGSGGAGAGGAGTARG